MLRIDDERRARGLDVLREQRDGTWRPPVSDPGRKAAFNIVGSVIGSAFAVFGVVGLARDGATSGAVLLTCLGLLLGAGNMWGARHFLRIRRQRMTEAGDEQG